MKPEDYEAASAALIDWFQSQDIAPEDAVIVAGHTIAGLIVEIANVRGIDPKKGIELVAKAMRISVRDR